MSPKPNLDDDQEPSLTDTRFDDAAFEIFFKEYFIPLCTYCEYRFGFDIDLAKEAVHSGFIRFWENRNNISPRQSPKAYLYKIVTNKSLDLLKHQKVKQQHEKYIVQSAQVSCNTNEYGSADFKELKNDIDKAILELPEQMRAVFELSRYEGLKYLEIADHLGISVKTVETQMSRALVKLRQKLAHYLALFFIISLFYS